MTATLPPPVRTLAEVREERRPLVDLAAHRRDIHPRGDWGCPWCPDAGVCPSCSLPAAECADPAGHRRLAAGAEQTWRKAA